MKLIWLSILTVLLLSPVAAQESEFVGYRHKGVVYGERLANGAQDLGGSLLSNENYGVTRYAKSGKHFLWLEKMIGRDRDGVPFWLVKDVLEFAALRKNQAFIFGLSSTCTQRGRENPDLIVFAELAKNGRAYRALKAWRANLKREKFVPTSVRGIRCEVAGP